MYSVQFKLADVSDAMAIVRLRQQIWSTTYRGIYCFHAKRQPVPPPTAVSMCRLLEPLWNYPIEL